jgi:hypothetical protein
MFLQSPLTQSGKILPLGSSTSLQQALKLLSSSFTPEDHHATSTIAGSFVNSMVDVIDIDHGQGRVLQQFILPEGLHAIETNQQMAAALINHFMDQPEKPDVVLFLVDRNNLESVRELEYWVRKVQLWMEPSSEVILLCYQSTPQEQPVVSDDTITNAVYFIEQEVSTHLSTWIGSCNRIDIQNPTSRSISIIRNLISRCILRSKGLSIMEGVILPLPSYSEYF